eukprot:459986-Pyramimonas_sp.AAC.1
MHNACPRCRGVNPASEDPLGNRRAGPPGWPGRPTPAGAGSRVRMSLLGLDWGRDTSQALQDYGLAVARTADFEDTVKSLSDGTFPSAIDSIRWMARDANRGAAHLILDSFTGVPGSRTPAPAKRSSARTANSGCDQ